jgi:serpin B
MTAPNLTRRHALHLGLVAAAAVMGRPLLAADAPADADLLTPFTLNFYGQVAAGNQDNVFFSPLSIAEAFGMLQAGARGPTADELAKALGVPQERMPQTMAAINAILTEDQGPVTLSLANAIWVLRNYPLRPEFTQAVAKYSAAGFNCDFTARPDAERQRINQWVTEKTSGRILDLLPPDSVTTLTRLVLTNAIYFKADWARRFTEELTRDGDFTLASGERVKAKLMSQRLQGCGFFEDEWTTVVEMPYAGERLAMMGILPRTGTIADLEKLLTAQRLGEITRMLRGAEVAVTLPRFKLDTSCNLIPVFKKLGVQRAFTAGQADLSGITSSAEARDLYVTGAFHKAFVEVNEKGTEAAAATGIVVGVRSVAPRMNEFRGDRPFVFLIRDRKTGQILFMGRLMNPA